MSETVVITTIDGERLTLGVGRLSHLIPDNIVPTYGVHGPDGLSFELATNPYRPLLELREFTPIDYYDGAASGDPDWSGFLIDTPRRSTGVSVQAKGWWHHTMDHSHPLMYVHSTLGDWKDVREFVLTYPNDWSTCAGVVQRPGLPLR
jgi:hypothetical protein